MTSECRKDWELGLDSGLVTLDTAQSAQAVTVHCLPGANTEEANLGCEGHLFLPFAIVTKYLQ